MDSSKKVINFQAAQSRMKEHTINELLKVFRDAGLEYYVKKNKEGVVKVHFLVKRETNEA